MGQLTEEGADEAARRYLIPSHVIAKGAVQLRLPRQRQQRVVMTAQNRRRHTCSSTASTTRCQVGTPRRRGAMRKTTSTAQSKHGHGLTADYADRGLDLDAVDRSAH
jgi:hypothetical protein